MKRSGFTLIELLAATAVLALILVLFVQAIGAVSRAWKRGAARIDNFSKARVILSLFDRDIQAAVLRRDLAAFVDADGRPAFAFYAKVRGGNGDRRLALIRYFWQPGAAVLQRRDYGMNYVNHVPRFSEPHALLDLGNASSQDVADGIIGFGWQFLDAGGSLQADFHYDYDQPQSPANTKAVVVALLVIDDSALRLARESGRVSDLLAKFADPPGPGKTYADAWSDTLSSPGFGANLPAPVREGIRTFQRRILFP